MTPPTSVMYLKKKLKQQKTYTTTLQRVLSGGFQISTICDGPFELGFWGWSLSNLKNICRQTTTAGRRRRRNLDDLLPLEGTKPCHFRQALSDSDVCGYGFQATAELFELRDRAALTSKKEAGHFSASPM